MNLPKIRPLRPRDLRRLAVSAKDGVEFSALMIGIISSLVLTVIGFAAAALWVFATDDSFFYLSGYFNFLIAASLLLGGFLGGNKAEERGLTHGYWIGIFYALGLVILNLTFLPELVTLWAAVKLIIAGVILGGVGGVAGVNWAFNRKVTPRARLKIKAKR